MGFESRIRFEVEPLHPRPYAPHEFLVHLDTDPPSLECNGGVLSVSPRGAYEYRPCGAQGTWPALTISVESDGFLILENDRFLGAKLLGPLVKYALCFARNERVTVEAV